MFIGFNYDYVLSIDAGEKVIKYNIVQTNICITNFLCITRSDYLYLNINQFKEYIRFSSHLPA
jgi:hypothetical protein